MNVLLGTCGATVVGIAASALIFACSPAPDGTSSELNGSGGSGGSGTAGSGGAQAGGGGQGGSFYVPTTGGAAGSGAGATCSFISEGTEAVPQPVDIIVAVDTSGSMDDEAAWTQAAMPNLAQKIVGSGIDTHVVMISSCNITVPSPLGSGSACPSDSLPPNYLHVEQEVGSRDALEVILNTYPAWQSMLRPESKKQFLVVSDDDSDISAADFTTRVNALDPVQFQPDNWIFHGIFAFTPVWDIASPCFLVAANQGTVYFDLTVQTLGLGGDLCSQNFDPIFDRLATSVVESAELSCEWAIPPPEEGEIDPNLVNVIFTGTGGEKPLGYVASADECAGVADAWYYDDNTNPTRIYACPSTCTELKSAGALRIDIQFGCERRNAIPR